MAEHTVEDLESIDDAAFRTWYLDAVLRHEQLLSAAERKEIERWPKGRRDDARVAALVVAGRADSPEVRAWVTRFHRTALAYLHRWGQSAADAEDLVQTFWRYAFQTRLFAKYTPRHAALGTYMFRCFVNSVRREARAAAEDAAAVPVEDQVLVAHEPSALETAETTELLRRAARCLDSLGMREGEAGWLIRQVHLEERPYASVAEQLFDGEPGDRLKQEGRLRRRMFSALSKLRACLNAAGVDGR